MSKVAEFYSSVRESPFIAVEIIWAVGLIADGTYLLLPAYAPVAGSVLAQFAGSPAVSLAIACFYIITGVFGLYAAYIRKRWARNTSTIMFFMAFFFTVLIRLLAIGFVPTIWVWPLLLALVAVIDNWNVNWKRYSDS